MEEFPSGQRGQTVNLLRNVSMVRIRPPPPFIIFCSKFCFTRNHGSIAQLGEHLPYKQRVTGSNPVVPTILFLKLNKTYAGMAQR
jgi:hypothetical protein